MKHTLSLICLAAAIPFSATHGADVDPKAAFMLARLSESFAPLRTFECSVEETHTSDSGDTRRNQFCFKYSNGHEWIQRVFPVAEGTHRGWDVMAWDGKTTKLFLAAQGNTGPQGAIFPDRVRVIRNTPFGAWMQGEPKQLQEMIGLGEFGARFAGEGSVEGQSVQIIEILAASNELEARLFIAPALKHGLVRFEGFANGKIFMRTDYTLRLVDGIPVPVVITKIGYDEEGAPYDAGIVKLTDIVINQPIEDRSMEITFPEGTKLRDDVVGVSDTGQE